MKRFQVSKIQKQFWILNGMNPESGSYNLFSVFRLSKPLDPKKLEEAVKYVIDRHEPLRTSFDFVDNELYQIIRTASETKFSVNTISIDQPFDQSHIHPSVVREANKPFDLSSAPLCRVSLFTFNDNVTVLTIVMHHIIVDVRSEGVFASELSARYNYLEGKEQILPPDVPYQYSDYISEINDWYESEEFTTKLELMASACPDPNSRIQLPEDFFETKKEDDHGSEVFFSIDEELTKKVNDFSEKNNINPYRLFLTAYALFLNRLSGQEQIYIGLPLTNRTRPVSKTTFGCFINALPLFVDFNDDKDLVGTISSVKGTLSEMLDRQEVPFTDLVNYTRDENTTTVNPYFQTGYAFKPPMQLELDGIEAQILKVEKTDHQTEFDLLLTFYPEENTFTGYITYSRQLFKRETIEKWIGIFKQIVIQLIESPDLSVGDVDILTDDDKASLEEFNNTSFPITSMLIHELIEKQAGLTPDKTAVISGDSQLTYHELDDQATQMANYLIEKGVRTGDSVGVCLERSAEMIVSILGVLKAGCTYIPMDPSFPDDRIKYMFEDSEASLLITQSSLAGRFSGFDNATFILIDNDKSEIYSKSTEKPSITADQLSIAYMIYTSGSTGKPKGVEVYHRGVVNLVESMSRVPGITNKDILLAVVTLSFDMSVYEIYLPLSNGATVVIASSADTTDGQALINLIEKHNVTMLQATPSLWNILLGSGWKGKKDLRAFCGGEALTKNMVRQALPRVAEFWNCYGPTETTVYSACMRVTDPDAPIVIGKPIGNTRIYILDKFNNNIPVGMTGEVCIGGLGVTKGYCKLPELTKEKFINLEDNEIVYKTGDLGRFLPDGTIELFGRIDNQIKLRGFRIEPGEIENLLSRIDGIREAVVKIHKFEETDDRLVAFLNTEPSFDLSNENVNNFLSQHLPPYMIPSFYQVSNGFPRLPNGKINKKALVFSVDEIRKDDVVEFENLSATQKKMYTIWSEILRMGNINPSSNFFDIGGNSLLVISILNRIKEEIGITISFRDFISNPTVIGTAGFIDKFQKSKTGEPVLIHHNETTNLPLSLNQSRLWLISNMHPDIASYIIPVTYRLSGYLDASALKESIKRLFDRHHIVFSVFKEKDGVPYCDIVKRDIEIFEADYSDLPEEESSRKVKELFNIDSRKPFDLKTGPVYRIYLIKKDDQEYFLRISIHHIVFDGWSWSILAKDLSRIYNGIVRKQDINMPLPEFQQYDFAYWESEFEKSNKLEESIEFWRQNLSGANNLLNFPYDFPRKDKPSGRAYSVPFRIPSALSDKLRNLSKKGNASLFTTMLSIFGVAVQKYSSQYDINIGIPIAYRPHSKLEDIFGMFVNTIVVRIPSDQSYDFLKALKITNEATLDAIAHQEVPFEKIVEIVKPDRNSKANPLFQVGFAWQNNLGIPLSFDNVTSEPYSGEERPSIFDILMYMWEDGDVIAGEIEYSIDILKPDTMMRFRDHFLELASKISKDAGSTLSELSMISEGERKMIDKVNSTLTPYPSGKNLVQLFEESTGLYPDNIATIFGPEMLTYSELNDRAEKVAAVLQTYNIGKGDFIGVWFNRSTDMIVCLLAILKTGAAYVPMNTSDPYNRISSIIKTARLKYVITSPAYTIEPEEEVMVIDIGELINISNSKDISYKKPAISPDDHAYIIFTSGTTGVPKGVLLKHKPVVNLISWVNNTFNVGPGDKLIWNTSICFDLSVYDIFGILASGATIRILSDEERQNPKKEYDILINEGITFWDSAPQGLQQLVDMFGRERKPELYKSLRLVFLSGDWIPLSLPEAIKSTFSSSVVVGLGGATEAAIWSNYFIVDKVKPEWKSIPYGKPIQNARYYVLDENLNHCRINQPGDLYIGGECLAEGYYNSPDLTEAKFIPDPYNKGGRMYFTGDKAQWMPDGNIEFLGREDNQVKIRGFRVEIGEIRNAVLQNGNIKDAVIIPDKSDRHEVRLLLFIIAYDNAEVDTRKIKNELRSALPEYMIPEDILHLPEFPLTANSKIDTRALMNYYRATVASRNVKSEISDSDKAALSETQIALLKIWSEVINRKDITLTDDFFDIGGNSLTALRCINKIDEVLSFSMNFGDFVACSNIAKLSSFIDEQTGHASSEIKLVHTDNKTNLPVTLNQKRLWILFKLNPDLPSYVTQFSIRLTGLIDVELFRKSLDILFNRHHILFSVIREKNGEPFCDIVPENVNLSIIDYSDKPSNEALNSMNDFFSYDSFNAFNLETGPLYRLFLIKMADDEYVFRLSVHHIIFDGWSWSVFANDLNKIYYSLLNGNEPDIEKIDFQQYDYAQWEQSPEGQKLGERSVDFWKSNLKESSSVISFPYDFPRNDIPSGRGRFEPIHLSRNLTSKLRAISKTENASLFATVLCAYGIQLHKYTGDDDINIGLPVAYRPHSKLESIIGMFVNTVVVRLQYENDFTFRDVVRLTNKVALDAIAHQDLPFEKVVELVNPERFSSANPIFQVAFDWQNNLIEPLDLEGIKSENIQVRDRTTVFDITLYIWENGDSIEGEIEYNVDILKADTIKRFRDHFITLLNNLVDNPDVALDTVSMMAHNDRKMLESFNATSVTVPDLRIHELFEVQAEEHPSVRAVASGDTVLSYGDLNHSANQVAAHLIKNGVRPGDVVGLCLERSHDMVISVLGILKAGCAYLPMDPSFPDDRIKYMYEDSGAGVLITQNSLQDKFSKFSNTKVILVDRDAEAISSNSDENPGIKISPDNLAYMIYTSGSTGKPKGVKVHHGAVVNFLGSMRKQPGFSTHDRLLAVTTLSFDISVLEIFLPLTSGGEVVIATADDISDGQVLSGLLEKHDITIMQATPATWNILLGSGWTGKQDMKALCGGEAILPGLIKELLPKVSSLWNMYGPTETTVWSTCMELKDFTPPVLVGNPIDNTKIYILDRNNRQLPVGVTGEVCIGGLGVTKGYNNRPELTSEKFIKWDNGDTIYKTGDFGRYLADGNIELFGRIDNQIKLRGFRIEPGEIESLLSRLPGVREAVVKVQKFGDNDDRLVAFLNVEGKISQTNEEIKNSLSRHLPAYMIPSFIVLSDSFPRLPNGKINKKALHFKVDERETENETDVANLPEVYSKLLSIWKKILKINAVGVNTNFFDAGGTSVLIPQVVAAINKEFKTSLRNVNVFEYPTVKTLAEFLTSKITVGSSDKQKKDTEKTYSSTSKDIAVIGMAGCFPGADNIEKLWDIIKNGEVSISSFSREELKNNGVSEELLDDKDYVYANYMAGRADMFDSAFFEISPREADFMDPQHRLFLETCYEALEYAGYSPRNESMNIGVFAGAGLNTYLIKSLMRHPDALRSIGEFQTMVSNDKDFVATRVSYKLNLSGPSMDVQTACSTSMTATYLACQSLMNHDCDMALSGGVTVQFPRGKGYLYQKGGILSPTGYCRPFDDKADGTVIGEGAGVILLKRLDDAVKDKDTIYAVIKSVAINNDGALKVSYMAPSLDGEARVIRKAQEQAGIAPETISYVETHGTGTKLGDPIEIGALKKVFVNSSSEKGYCALGGIKANIGHLDAASGIAGIIKAILVLRNRQIPPLANFTSLNQELELEDSPFYINTELKDWEKGETPRRAAVSSFGIGGTNAHCILEEWDSAEEKRKEEKKYHLLPVSAMTKSSLNKMIENYNSFFESTDLGISDIAYTMQKGRESFRFRHMIVTDDLKDRSRYINVKGTRLFEMARTAFMFTGQGSQYLSMSKGLYDQFVTFRKYIDYADNILSRTSTIELKELLYNPDISLNINDTSLAQPALVAVQYATVKLLEEFGIRPDILIGHSIGELTAACVSGVFSFEDALVLSAGRGKIMFEQEKGSMLSVNLPAEKVKEILIPGTEISLINAPKYCVVSGSESTILLFKKEVAKKYPGVQTVILKTSHAFHSKSMEPAVEPFRAMVEKTTRKDVNIPFISNTSGLLITNDEARSASYWSDHIRETVNFEKGVKTLLESESVCIEIGPGSTLTSLLSQFNAGDSYKSIPTMRGAKQEADDVRYFLEAVSQFWIAGGLVRWDELYNEPQQRVALPTYVFNRKKHWIEASTIFVWDNVLNGEKEEKYETQNTEADIQESIDRSGFIEDYVEPTSEIQKNLQKIWENSLGIKGIGIVDDFFVLGGHSLLASQVINRVNDYYKTDLPIDTLFRTSTIEKLEKIVEQSGKSVSLKLNSGKTDSVGKLPVSNEQKRLWAISRIYNNPSYNLPFTYKFKGIFDEEIFVKSLEVVFNRHTVLRGRFTGVGAEPAFIIDKDQKINIQKYNFTEYESSVQESMIEQVIGDDIRKVFDLDNDPLYRIYLIKTGEEDVLFHMTIHHVIFDGWSWGVFISDLKSAYSGLLINSDFEFSNEANQYYEYARWQQTGNPDVLTGKSVDYWEGKLKGYNGVLNFPYDFPRKETRSGYGQKEYFTINSKIRSDLKNVARNLNVTDFTIYISAFSILLNKYSNDDDICIGIPSANRSNYQLEEIVGFFVNTLVLRFMINDNKTFAEYAEEAKKLIVEAIEHQDLLFEKLVEVLKPQRSINTNPVFQVLFAWLNTPSEKFEFPGVQVERCTIKRCVAPLDIAIYLWEGNGVIEGEIEYSTDILTSESIGLLIENYIHLLAEIAANSQQTIGNIDLLSPADIELQDQFNQTKTEIPPMLLHQLFEANVSVYPDKKAVIYKDGFLTYSELNRRADQLAGYLIKSGVKPKDVVGISLERSFSMLISVLAVLKAGATYLPLDPLFPADRNRFMLSDSDAGLVITQEIFKDRFSESSARIICIDTISDELELEEMKNVSVTVDGDSVAYMIYTSGSTGLPKGVKVHHRAAVNFINSMASEPGFTKEDTLLAVTTLSFDISVLELFLPLYCGGSIVMAQTNDIAVGDSLIWLINNFNVTVLQATPATWYILLQSGWVGNKKLKALCGGEAISPGLIKRLLPRVSELWNMYGPTETTVWSTCYRITDPDAPVLIGRPIKNTTIYILSENNQIQPIGVPGELCIGGAGVSKGYHNREDLTDEKFVKGPDEQIIYRTGDVGRFRSDGNIELYGRIDNQIKVRGFRIEPGEIESQLCKINGIEKAVVKVIKFSEIDERLGAFIIVNESYSESKDSLIGKLRINLPEYMIPRGFKKVNEFPLTPNGKIDRKQLDMDLTDFSMVTEKSTEKVVTSDVERRILDIWKSELNMSGIGVNDNFFDIGGNSILLIQLSDKINKLLESKIDVLYYFQYPTIRSFCSFVTQGQKLKDSDDENRQRDYRARQIELRRRRRME